MGFHFCRCQGIALAIGKVGTASHPELKPIFSIITQKLLVVGCRLYYSSYGIGYLYLVTNCTFSNIDDSGLKIQLNEGGTMKNMNFSNLIMKNVPRPVFMTFCQQRACVDSPEEMYPMESMKNFIFSNIIVDNSKLDKNSAFLITGLPGHDIENILFRDIQFTVSGGGTMEDAKKQNLNEYTLEVLDGWWPEFSLVGTLPASGIYARHINGLSIDNFRLRIEGKDERPAVVLDDVKNDRIKNVTFNNLEATKNDIVKR